MAGGPSEEVTPVPISNTEVKLFSSDGTWTQPGPGRVARRRTEKLSRNAGLLCLWMGVFALPIRDGVISAYMKNKPAEGIAYDNPEKYKQNPERYTPDRARESEQEDTKRYEVLMANQRRLESLLEEDLEKKFSGKEGMKALKEELEGDPLFDSITKTEEGGNADSRSLHERLQEIKVPLSRTFSLGARFRKFMLGNENYRELLKVQEEKDRLRTVVFGIKRSEQEHEKELGRAARGGKPPRASSSNHE